MLTQQRPSAPIEDRVGPYQLIMPVGEGGMGLVYRAQHRETGRFVALKVVRVVDESLLASFRREIFALRCIDHPGVVRIVDDGVSDGQPWYAMDLVRGGSLAEYIDAVFHRHPSSSSCGPGASGEFLSPSPDGNAPTIPPATVRPGAPLDHVLTLMRALCGPLAYVHGLGIVHRDLKPENILIRDDGTPVLLDFGLALHFGGGERGRDVLDVAGRALGTPPYMAPEQIRGDLVDARADLYALGCILYECLTGMPPFTGPAVTILQKHLSEVPPTLSEEDGVPAALGSLVARLLAKRPRDRIGYAADVAAALRDIGAREIGEAPPTARPYLYRPSLAGRHAIMDELKPLLQSDAAHTGGAVFIGGESGVGKTRLAMELGTWAARRGVNVVTSQCLDTRGGDGLAVKAAPLHPLRPLLQTVTDRCRTVGVAETDRLLGDRGPLLALYEPTIGHLPFQDAQVPELPADAARYRLVEAVACTLKALADVAPVLLVIDDLQWADELTLGFLRHFHDQYLASAGVFIVGTFRADERSPALDEVLAAAKTVELGMLDRAAVARMVADMLALDEPPEALVDFLMRESEGNPFFIAEYLRAAIVERIISRSATGVWSLGHSGASSDSLRSALPLPGGVRDLVRRRVEQLDGRAHAMAEVAAVIGREIDGDMLTEASGLDDPRAAIEQLRARQVLEEDDKGGLRFIHDKVREVIYDGIASEQRARLHLSTARAIEAAARGPLDYPVLAHHFTQGGDYHKAIDYLEKAGEQALSSAASGEASRLFRRALELCAEHGIVVDDFRRACWERRLGEAHYNLGDLSRAKQGLLSSLERLRGGQRSARWGALLSSAAAVAAQLRTLLGRSPPVSQRLETRARYREAALAAERLSQVHYFLNEQNRAFGASLECAHLAENLGPSPELARAYATLSVAMGFVPLPLLVKQYIERADDVARRVGDPQARGFVAFMRGLNGVGAGEHREAKRSLMEALSIAESTGDVRAAQEIESVLCEALSFGGEAEEMIARGQALVESGQRTHNKQAIVWGKGSIATTHARLGAAREALAFYEEIAPITAETGDTSSALNEALKGVAYLMAGDWAEARRVADHVRAHWDASPSGWHVCPGYIAACEVYLAFWERALVKGEPVEDYPSLAKRACRVLEGAARYFEFARSAALLYRGLFHWHSGHHRKGMRLWRKALAEGSKKAMPFDIARAHYEMGRHLPADDLRRETHATRARELYQRLGAERWVELSRALPPCWP